jgi:hypothetical protein
MFKLCTNKNHSYKHNEQINSQNIDNSECFDVKFSKIYPEMTSNSSKTPDVKNGPVCKVIFLDEIDQLFPFKVCIKNKIIWNNLFSMLFIAVPMFSKS